MNTNEIWAITVIKLLFSSVTICIGIHFEQQLHCYMDYMSFEKTGLMKCTGYSDTSTAYVYIQ